MSHIINTLKTLDDDRGDDIERWLQEQRAKSLPFFTTSVDLRHSGLRLAPVDTNLFPAGFNNLSPQARARASRFIARFIEDRYAQVKRVLIIPENHTRNLFYLENLAVFLSFFEAIGIEAKLGSLVATDEPIALLSASGIPLVEYPLKRDGDRLMLADGFTPDLVVMNNDMSSGAPPILKSLVQPVAPPVGMGWYRRRKSVHFGAYRALAQAFGEQFALDPWLICAEFYHCGIVDFKQETGLDRVAKAIDAVLASSREKHREYGITEEPYVFVKAESGTYGMGVMTARSGAEMFELNKKARNKMQTIKEGESVSEVMVQEGVPTVDRVDGRPAEPMVYMIDGVPIGGMYRVNGERDAFTNLNAPGMSFSGMCDEAEDECGKWKSVTNCDFRAFGLIAAIAALAAAREDYTAGRDGAGI